MHASAWSRLYARLGRVFWELRSRDLDRRYGSSLGDAAALEAVLAKRRPRSVLEVGCGAGRLVPVYERQGVERLVGVDISERALVLARRRHGRHCFVRAAASELPELGSFELAVAFRALQHVDGRSLERVLDRLTSLAGAIFLQERRGGRGHPYLFVHDYDTLLAARGFACSFREGDAALYSRRSKESSTSSGRSEGLRTSSSTRRTR